MRDQLIKNLSTKIDRNVVVALVGAYEAMIGKFRRHDIEGCLTKAGLFVEHTFRAVEFLRTGLAPAEIKSASATVREIEKDANLSDSLRFLIPRVAYAMIYEIRSKRGAVHVKEIDPRNVDASLSVSAASWVVAEFLRLYHSSDEAVVSDAMQILMRGHIPFIETFGDETIVTKKVSCWVELLLLIVESGGGLDRRTIGQRSKFPAPRVTENLQSLLDDRYVHQTRDGRYHITGPGEAALADKISSSGSALPVRTRH